MFPDKTTRVSSRRRHLSQTVSHRPPCVEPPKPSADPKPLALYPTPPPSPDLEQVAPLIPAADPVETFVKPRFQPQRTTPAIPISLLLNTPHTLPHGAPFKLAQPNGILSVLGGNRVLQLDGASILDRMPYSSAKTNGVVFTENQGEEDSVEAMLGGRPASPETRSIFVHPPTPDREQQPSRLEPPSLRRTASEASPRTSPAVSPNGSPNGSPRVGKTAMMALPLQVLPEVRSPPRRALEMTTDSLRIAQQRGRRPKLFGFTELPDSSESSATSSRNPSPERPSMLVTQSQDSTSTSSGPATSSPGNFLPRRSPIRARSETSLSTIIHSATPTNPSTLSQTSTISPRPADDTRGRRNTGLKLDFTGIIPLNTSSSSDSKPIPSPYSARLIRKKSGEILKPALKYGGPLAANGTPLEAPPKPEASRARFASKSAPTTPSCPKYVHFDSQLERIKLFNGEQKPSVVSRSGSPTAGDYTTSEGEEYPFPSTDEEGFDTKKLLQIKLPNFPVSHPPDSDLFLESLFLDDDRKSLRGMVQVRNISFQKWVAIRFTLDWWQTTSEVTATHKDSVRGGSHDRFAFTIKLHDLLPKIEEKTLFLAIRYNTEGREIWDSNEGRNYQVLFEKVKPVQTRLMPKRGSATIQPGMGKAIGGRTSQWSVTQGESDDRLADLRARLDRLHADDLSPPQLSPASSRHTSFSPQRRPATLSSGSPQRSVSTLSPRIDNLPAAGPALAARYDFSSALQGARRNSNSPNRTNADLPEVRTGLLRYGQSLPAERGRPTMDFYSPRSEYTSLPGGGFFSPPVASQSLSGSTSASSSATVTPAAPGLTSAPTVTPASASTAKPASPPAPSPTAAPSSIVVPNLLVQGPSPEPSPNAEEPTSSNSVSPPNLDPSGSVTDDTPSESPKSPPEANMGGWSPTSDKTGDSQMASYASFVEQFCWGGGAPVSNQLERPSFERRAHSTSSLDAYFHPANTTAQTGTPSESGSYFPNGSSSTTPHGHSHSHSISSTPSGSYFSSYSSSSETLNRQPSSSGSGSNSAIGLDFGNSALELNMSSRSNMSPPEVY